MQNVNTVVITGNLTRDPELRYARGGNELACKLRVAVSGRRKDGESGEWVDKPNYFDVAVWGGQAESCANYLARGRAVAIAGRLDWHEWEDAEGARRESVEVIAGTVQFLDSPVRETEAAREEVAA